MVLCCVGRTESAKLHVHAHGMTEMSSSQRANWAEASERKQSSSEIPTMLHFGTSLHRSGQGTAERVVLKKQQQTNRETSRWNMMNETLLFYFPDRSQVSLGPGLARGLREERRGAATAGISSTAPRPPGRETQKRWEEETRECVCVLKKRISVCASAATEHRKPPVSMGTGKTPCTFYCGRGGAPAFRSDRRGRNGPLGPDPLCNVCCL